MRNGKVFMLGLGCLSLATVLTFNLASSSAETETVFEDKPFKSEKGKSEPLLYTIVNHTIEEGVLTLEINDGTYYTVDTKEDEIVFRGDYFKVLETPSAKRMIFIPKELEEEIGHILS